MANKIIERINEYERYKDDLNWRDDGNDSPDGQHVEDPSINDFNKGYKMDPYSLRYFANLNKDMLKIAWKEVDPLSFKPEYLADKILKLWNQIDGPLQNVFEAFTLRYDNKLKQEIAKYINQAGYEVYPILLIDAPLYASSNNSYGKKLIKLCNKLIPTFGLKHLVNDIKYIMTKRASNNKIDLLLDYYNRLFPEDYSLSLLKTYNVDKLKSNSFEEFRDIQISDENLEMLEQLDSGSLEPLINKDGGPNGYDFVSDMREDTTAPNVYEVTSKKKVKLAEEEEKISIPLELVLDVLSEASNNVNILLNRDLKRSPVPVSTYIRKDISNIPDKKSYESEIALLNNEDEVWEVWEIFLKDKTNVFVVIYANCITKDYKFFDWDNIQYKGFYSTKQEAINEIKGYL